MVDATNAKSVRVNREILTISINLKKITLVIVASSKSNFHKHSFKLTKLRLDQMESLRLGHSGSPIFQEQVR